QEGLEHPWFAPGEPPVIISAGRLSAEKDYSTLIKAFALLRQKRPARLVILGQGAIGQALQDQACELKCQDDILLAGFQSNPYKWMSRASVFVLSSRWEGFGNVLVE